jgi:eukaryotic-like serine/threonine-protein kinase
MQATQLPFAAPPEWKGTERYTLLRRVGEGGMGVVYEARDREGHRGVALKTLLRVDPNSLYLFKQEFRTLADVHHRNLVHLYELVQPTDGPLFFAMELVDGADFIAYAHHLPRVRDPRQDSSSTLHPGAADHVTRQGRARTPQMSIGPPAPLGDEPTRADSSRLRPALRQLVQGLGALHAAGKLHRDIKPSNVLVTDEGRVVILDFGIALELSRAARGDQRDGDVVGTPKYMSPEQAAGEVPTPASDWYAVGVMLYEALAARLPFEGPSIDVLSRKMREDPLPPSTWARGIPPDLEALCIALLQQQPSERPDGAEILRRLGAVGSTSVRSQPARAAEAHPPLLVGREEQLRALREALDLVTVGQSVTLRISGGAGMGKSTLVQHFLDELEAGGEVVMLCGRAYERESVPYKAVDSLVDSLATLLCRIEEAEGPFSTPEHAPTLARLFPVLKRVPSFAVLPEEAVADAQSVRHNAFGALRELLGSLARRRPLVLYIDDVQWGDVDSVALLQEVIRPPKAPPLLLLMTYREEDAATSPFLIEMNDRWPAAADVRDVSVGRLDVRDAVRLALARMGTSEDPLALRTARAVAREAKGSPFLVEELVRSNRTQSAGTDATLGVLTLAEIVGERLARLPPGARRLAEVVAVGGRPLTLSSLADACNEESIRDDDVELLRSERIVRPGFRDGREVIEPSHDRIRETIVEQLPADVLRAHHRGLARALEAASGADMEAIAVHLLGSGEMERGARYAERAGEQAAAKLAFDQAARLYRLALETLPRTPDEARPVRTRLAAALEHAGRGAEAARVYLQAAEGAAPLQRVDLERAASQQLLFSGRTDEGIDLLRRVLAAVGIRAPRTPLGAILSLLFHRFLLRIRGLQFKERSPEEVSLEDRVRVEALFTVAAGFSVVDVVLGACMQARFLRLALDVGSRMNVLQATSVQITHLASQGGPIGKAERAAYVIAERLSQTIQNPDAEPYFAVCRGLSFFHRGRWREAREAFFSRAALQSDAAFSHARLFGVYTLFYLGKLREQARRADRLLADCERRGDLYTAVNLHAAPIIDCCLAADDPKAGREHIRKALATWTQNGFHIQHWKAMVWGAAIELYVGDGEAAYARLERDRRSYRRSLLDHSQFVRELTRYVCGCAAVASALDAPASVWRARLEEARAAARRLERQRMTWTAPLASLVLAAAANAGGDTATATIALRTAIERAEAADMALHAAAARHQLGCLLGGDEGAELRRQGETAMTAEGVRAPARMATMILPGRWGH